MDDVSIMIAAKIAIRTAVAVVTTARKRKKRHTIVMTPGCGDGITMTKGGASSD